jgi:hypothetical protein
MQQILLKITAVFLSLLTVLGLSVSPRRPVVDDPEPVNIPQPDYAALAAEEADWLWKQQLPNGAIAFYYRENGEVTVNPYFSAFAAIALTAYDGSPEAGERIKRFIEWYFAHLNTGNDNIIPGTIYDYTVTMQNGEIISEESTGKYDSTDSYSAFFLRLLWDYAERYGDITLLREHAGEIRTLLNVIYATRVFGYTFAKPSDLHLYLMDNCEVYAGVCAAEKIGAAIGDTDLQKKTAKAADVYRTRFMKDWYRDGRFTYQKVIFGPFGLLDYDPLFSWDNFYPDAAAQVYPVLWGLISPDSAEAKLVYENFCNSWKWESMEYIRSGVEVFYWGALALAGAKMGDTERVNTYLYYYGQRVNPGREYPLYCFDSAMVLMALITMMNAQG